MLTEQSALRTHGNTATGVRLQKMVKDAAHEVSTTGAVMMVAPFIFTARRPVETKRDQDSDTAGSHEIGNGEE